MIFEINRLIIFISFMCLNFKPYNGRLKGAADFGSVYRRQQYNLTEEVRSVFIVAYIYFTKQKVQFDNNHHV